jgi:transposase-like protein
VIDHEGEVLEGVVTAKREKAAAVKLLQRLMKEYEAPRGIVADGLPTLFCGESQRSQQDFRSEAVNVPRCLLGYRLPTRARPKN